MRTNMICLTVIAAIGLGFSAPAQAARTLQGTLQSGTHEALVVVEDGQSSSVTIRPAAGASVMRGQIGKDLRKVSLLDLAPGDRIVAVVNQHGTAPSIKGFYSVVRGTVARVQGQKVFLEDGKTVVLRSGVGVVFGEGKMVKPSEIKPGTLILARLNPTTQEAWTVVATEPAAVAPVKPALAPVITSIRYTGPYPPKVRDWVRIDLEGTPGGRATCYVKGLIPVTVMTEVEPGKYRASVMIPGGKPVKDAPLVGRLSIGTAEAEPVQAARLITVEPTMPTPPTLLPPLQVTKPETPVEPPLTTQVPPIAVPEQPATPEKLPEPVIPTPVVSTPAVPTPEPAPPAPAAVQAPSQPRTKAPVAVTYPADQARITRAILVKGTAEPRSQVLVQVSYTNSLGGILHMSGQVSSQLVAVNDKGEFAMGPIALEGPLATQGLRFTIEAFYPDSNGRIVSRVVVFGDR